jgi:alkanesulfonate monooxygenase SsuD/methylene tetrahydromethanopterin reductase-like flavin-dependent oxidoreductase (luciferase family)
MMAEHGFATEAAAIAEAWARGDRETAERAVSDVMIDATSVSGTPDQCRARIEAYRQSGADAKACFAAAIEACAPSD